MESPVCTGLRVFDRKYSSSSSSAKAESVVAAQDVARSKAQLRDARARIRGRNQRSSAFGLIAGHTLCRAHGMKQQFG
jgi:hypothetical protein